MTRVILLALLLSVATLAADISGTWAFEVTTDAGSGTPTFVFKQSGEKLTGTYSGQLGEAPINGTVKGDTVEWTFEGSNQGEKFTVSYRGTLDGAAKMKGTADLGGVAKGTFTANKK